MNTNFCNGCGAPLENSLNFEVIKCTYCGLENSNINIKKGNSETFLQRIFSFKKTNIPKRKINYSQTEEKYRERTKTIVDNKISQIKEKEIKKNRKLREKNFKGILWKTNIQERVVNFLVQNQFNKNVNAKIYNALNMKKKAL